MNQKRWAALIFVVAVAVNAVLYIAWRERRENQELVALRARDAAVQEERVPPAHVPSSTESDDDSLGRTYRAAGVAALEAGDFDRAIAEFTKAVPLMRDPSKVREMLKIAEDLRVRERATKPVAPPPAAPARAESHPVRAVAHPKRVASVQRATAPSPLAASEQRAERVEHEEPPAELKPQGALLLVTSTPRGLVVHVDNRAMDLTPARLSLRSGAHVVALYSGERKLFEKTVQLTDGDADSMDEDLTAQLAESRGNVAASTVPAVSRQPVAELPAIPAPRTQAHPANPVAPTTGDLDVSSPGLYGEVWINDHAYGYPPVTARSIAAGMTTVEIRVHGEVRRSMKVSVAPAQKTVVRVR